MEEFRQEARAFLGMYPGTFIRNRLLKVVGSLPTKTEAPGVGQSKLYDLIWIVQYRTIGNTVWNNSVPQVYHATRALAEEDMNKKAALPYANIERRVAPVYVPLDDIK